jgi:hypothetical protein
MSESLFAVGFAFVAISFLYLMLIAGTLWLLNEANIRLIVLGLLTAIAAIGYGGVMTAFAENAGGHGISASAIAVGSTVPLAGTLMKVAVILILTGVGRSLIAKPAAPETNDSSQIGGPSNV